MQLDESVFMTSDIRGTYPEQLNEDFAFVLGRGLARVLGARRVTLARDGRASSPTLYAATAAGLRHEGVEVRTLDLAALELLYHVMGEAGGGELGVMVTASHNPASPHAIETSPKASTAVRPTRSGMWHASPHSFRLPSIFSGSVRSGHVKLQPK